MKKIIIFGLILMSACRSFHIDLNQSLQSYSNINDVLCTHLNWTANIHFDTKTIEAKAAWRLKQLHPTDHLILDSRDLNITQITMNGIQVEFKLGQSDSSFGQGIYIPLQPTDTLVEITYTTSPEATAIQWLDPEQTAGKQKPYLFTQCESIYARSLLPCQDVPCNRITYSAHVQTPEGMMAVMSAKNPQKKDPKGLYDFEMEIPIPTYLIALAVGDIEYKAIDARSGVYTEPSMLEKSAAELSDIPSMMKAAEKLGGPYRWGQYDVLIAPPSFPIGGMENPRLTFATPTILAGDKSLVSLIAHEMAHSWSGNLVTNANWNDLWLNEGFTTYFERRIMEEISGESYTQMLWSLGYDDLQIGIQSAEDPKDTRLKLDIGQRHPEVAFSDIAYEKGAAFLRMLEEKMGRTKFDAFLNHYFQSNAFKPMTTEKCLAIMDSTLFNGDTALKTKLHVKDWVYKSGLPSNRIKPNPRRFVLVDKEIKRFNEGNKASVLKTPDWCTHEWLHFIRGLDHPSLKEKMAELDSTFHFTQSTNSEIQSEWYILCIKSNYHQGDAQIEKFLSTVGRKKFLSPIYTAMTQNPEYVDMATTLFNRYKNHYHPQAAAKIQSLLKVQKGESS